jgi:pyruvate dehydrogenase E2 component (dihydrolipoamide acetyltransferase)
MKQILVPDIGDYKGVNVIEVMVKPGDAISVDDTLLTLETDKAAMDVPSPYAGTVKELHVEIGDKVSQGSLILVLETADTPAAEAVKAEPAVPAPTPQPVAAAPQETQQRSVPSGQAHASPAIRRFARELGVDIARVSGSGAKGRVTKEDVQSFVKSALASGTGGGLQVADMPSFDFAKYGAIETVPLSRIQKISGANLHRNWVNIPHVTQFDEADITDMDEFRKQLSAEYTAQNIKITPLAFMMKAAVTALQQFPKFNASLDNENLVLKQYFHIGVAVDTPDGLVVPVLRDVDKKGVVQLAKELAEVSAKAREKKITAADMQGGCFTISSLGGIGGTAFTPIINAPEVAILGVSRAAMKPVYQDGEFVPRLMLPLSVSYDHRVIDGALAARFTTYLAQVLSDIRRLAL